MKLPRNLYGIELAKMLFRYGYINSRQTGSHIRLTTLNPSEHHITIPDHRPLRVGTLSAILNEVSNHLNISKEQLMSELFR